VLHLPSGELTSAKEPDGRDRGSFALTEAGPVPLAAAHHRTEARPPRKGSRRPKQRQRDDDAANARDLFPGDASEQT